MRLNIHNRELGAVCKSSRQVPGDIILQVGSSLAPPSRHQNCWAGGAVPTHSKGSRDPLSRYARQVYLQNIVLLRYGGSFAIKERSMIRRRQEMGPREQHNRDRKGRIAPLPTRQTLIPIMTSKNLGWAPVRHVPSPV